MTSHRDGSGCVLRLAIVLTLSLVPSMALAAPAETPVKVERVRPLKENLPTLRFLRANREFFRSRLDLLMTRPLDQRQEPGAIDKRFLTYRDGIAAAGAAGDSLVAAADADRRRTLFASVTELGALESQLDEIDRLLAEQRARLGSLEADFAGHPRTALAILVSGRPDRPTLASLALSLDDGTRLEVPLTAGERTSLANGGVLQAFYGLIEPREQSIAIAIGAGASDSSYVTLEPAQDRLTFLHLDLSGVDAANGAAGITASTWAYDDEPADDSERAPRP
jgi:hypothetical protein